MRRARVRNSSGASPGVPPGAGLPPSLALSLAPPCVARWCRPLRLVSRRVGVAPALVLFTLALSCGGAAQPTLPQREVLVALYEATDGPNWVDSTNWTTPAPLDEWYGVTTDAAGNVTELDLDTNQLRGPLPAALGRLSQLRSLDLHTNQLRGPLPAALAHLSALRYLALHTNQLRGPLPVELANLSQLWWLSLHSNALSGPLPVELGNLSQLQGLELHTNQLRGPLPVELGNLSQLGWLSLHNNALSGPLPVELGNLSQLWRLSLHSNQLSGPIPAALGHLSQLGGLELKPQCGPERDHPARGRPGGGQESHSRAGSVCQELARSGPAGGSPVSPYGPPRAARVGCV